MTKLKILVLIAVYLFIGLNISGCGKDETREIITNVNCSVIKDGSEAVITCPDGSTVTLPPQIINETIELIHEVPIIIRVNRGRCNIDKKD